MNIRSASLITGVLLFSSGQFSPAFAWGQNGHRVTAEIAERNLDKEALAVLRSIIGAETLAELSTWADDIRSFPEWDFVEPWHFVSIEDEQTWEDLLRAEADDEEINSILEILVVLEEFLRKPEVKTMELKGKFPQKQTITKRDAIAFYVHFVGDVHQPLHVGRKADQGGNKIQVEWFREEDSLHKVWDELLIESLQLSYTELSTFLNRIPEATRLEWSQSSHIDWARESKAVRSQVYDFGSQRSSYFLNDGDVPRLSWGYRSKALPVIRERLQQGGIRLAAKLNDIFASYPIEAVE